MWESAYHALELVDYSSLASKLADYRLGRSKSRLSNVPKSLECNTYSWRGGTAAFAAYLNSLITKDIRFGTMIAGNSGRIAGGCGDTKNNEFVNIHTGHKTQEENIVSNWVMTMEDNGTQREKLFSQLLDKTGNPRWGLIKHDSDDRQTYQGKDYTTAKPVDYYEAWEVSDAILSGENGMQFNTELVFVSGPNAGREGKSPQGSMARTLNKNMQNDYQQFRDGVKYAVQAGLEKMEQLGCEVALVAGVSTGIYAGPHKGNINKEFVDLVNGILNSRSWTNLVLVYYITLGDDPTEELRADLSRLKDAGSIAAQNLLKTQRERFPLSSIPPKIKPVVRLLSLLVESDPSEYVLIDPAGTAFEGKNNTYQGGGFSAEIYNTVTSGGKKLSGAEHNIRLSPGQAILNTEDTSVKLIHAVGPNYEGKNIDDEYYRILEKVFVAIKQELNKMDVRIVLLPLISSGIYAPKDIDMTVYMTNYISYINKYFNGYTVYLQLFKEAEQNAWRACCQTWEFEIEEGKWSAYPDEVNAMLRNNHKHTYKANKWKYDVILNEDKKTGKQVNKATNRERNVRVAYTII